MPRDVLEHMQTAGAVKVSVPPAGRQGKGGGGGEGEGGRRVRREKGGWVRAQWATGTGVTWWMWGQGEKRRGSRTRPREGMPPPQERAGGVPGGPKGGWGVPGGYGHAAGGVPGEALLGCAGGGGGRRRGGHDEQQMDKHQKKHGVGSVVKG